MKTPSLIRLLLLAAIWGASFLFMRIAAPVLGPVLLIEWRVVLAALFLFAIALLRRKALRPTAHWRHYLFLGLVNSALPFLLIAFAAMSLSASLLSILNATAPIWGALIGAILGQSRLTARVGAGLLLGVAGVGTLVGFDAQTLTPAAIPAIACALAAALCYGIASIYVKRASAVDAFANAHGSMWAAALLIAPAVPFFSAPASPDAAVVGTVIALGVLCSGVAYLLYFRLIADEGPASALTVTFLIPVFGVLLGVLFLGESIGVHTVAGSILVISGTVLATGYSAKAALAGAAAGKGVSAGP